MASGNADIAVEHGIGNFNAARNIFFNFLSYVTRGEQAPYLRRIPT